MKRRFILALLVLATCRMARAEQPTPRYFGVRPGALTEAKTRLAGGDQSLQPALKYLVEQADGALQISPPSVTEKTRMPPSGDKHDYLTLAPYWWPDPASTNGLPYIRHDGKVNPESREDAVDLNRNRLMGSTVETLALAYYFTGKEAYAEHAARCLRTWFLDTATRMNPNLNYAQGVPGVNNGRGTGIIEGLNIAEAADAAGLLAGSSAWTQNDDDALKAWLNTYLDWLLTSKNGPDEAGARNNHGTLYDVQAARLALIVGRIDLARQIVEAARQKRIAVQIEPDGRQPLELERTAAFSYSHLNLGGLFLLATLGEHVGADLWHYQLPDGRGLARALDFLLPYLVDPSKKWPYQQIKDFNRAEFAPLLRQAALAYNEPKYEKILESFPQVSRQRLQLLSPGQKPGVDVAAIDRERILKAAGARSKSNR